jgi:hypothetical protein
MPMSEAFVVQNPDPNNFVVSDVGGDHCFTFHVVSKQGGRALCPAAWAKLDPKATRAELHEMWSFAEREARKRRLIN